LRANLQTAPLLAALESPPAANRVSMIARIHHRLHSYDGVQTIEFRKFLEDFARDFSAMLSSDERPGQVLVEGVEIHLPAATAIPLGFIVSELITNAAKHGQGRIAICLQPDPVYGYALSVSNNGPALPKGFDPAAGKGLGMKIIQSFTRQIEIESNRQEFNPAWEHGNAEAERFGPDCCIRGLCRNYGSGGGRPAPRTLRTYLRRTRRAYSPPRNGDAAGGASGPE
jgi:hypothetical protein